MNAMSNRVNAKCYKVEIEVIVIKKAIERDLKEEKAKLRVIWRSLEAVCSADHFEALDLRVEVFSDL